MTGRAFKIMVALPFVLIPIGVMASRSVSFERMVLEPDAIELLAYSSTAPEEDLLGRPATARAAAAGFNPFRAEAPAAGPIVHEAAATGERPSDGRLDVTLTVLDAGGNMAVINDKLVREGDFVGGMRVKRIENNRVTLVNRQSVPVYLEGNR